MKLTITTAIALILTLSAHAAILTVKQDSTGDFTTIQAAIDASSDYDTVLVWPGTYYEHINYNSKAIMLASLNLTTGDESYIYSTIIDGSGSGCCVAIENFEDVFTSLYGFTIQNGNSIGTSYYSGGISVKEDAKLNIYNCLVQNNFTDSGAAICCTESYIFLSNTIIRYNYSIGSFAAGLHVGLSDISFDTIQRNSIYLNTSKRACDVTIGQYSTIDYIYLDTCTVLNPDYHFIAKVENWMPLPLNNIHVNHGYLQPVNSDLYVDPVNGDNNNSGLSETEALKTLWFAVKKHYVDSINPNTIHLMNGEYSSQTNGEKFPVNLRSHLILKGQSRDSVVFLDPDIQHYLFGNLAMEDITVENITMSSKKDEEDTFAGFYTFYASSITSRNLHIHSLHANPINGLSNSWTRNATISNVIVENNIGGKGIIQHYSELPVSNSKIENSIVRDITSQEIDQGGIGIGITADGSELSLILQLVNCEISGCTRWPDPGWGPGIGVALLASNHANVDVVNTTIADNTVIGERGFAVIPSEGAHINLYNCILYGDSLNELALGYPNQVEPASALVSYTNIEGGQDSIWLSTGSVLDYLEGNIDADPKWDTAAEHPYSLMHTSPCIDAGVPMYEFGMAPPYIQEYNGKYLLTMHNGDTVSIPATDLTGNPRIVNGRIDMGAYEFQDTGVNVNPTCKKRPQARYLAKKLQFLTR